MHRGVTAWLKQHMQSRFAFSRRGAGAGLTFTVLSLDTGAEVREALA